nr:histone deacetylase HDT1-like isoform X1 [Coffea arabica]
MEFWAAEVKGGEPFKVEPGEGMVLHLSQASIGEVKKEKGNETICLFVNVDGQRLVLGTLFSEKLPQQQFDLVFDRNFELSHNWKSGSVYFYGYRANNPFDEEDDGGDFDSDSEEEIPLTIANNGKPEIKVKEDKPADNKKAKAEKDSKQKVKIVEPNLDLLKRDGNEDSSDEDDDSSDEDDDASLDEVLNLKDEDESDTDGDDESDESDEETPKKVEISKKRAIESAVKTPGPDKKAKLTTPQKTDGKKGSGHVATPHPAKQAGKNKNQQTPKSGGGSHTCKTCSRGFGSENALESHTKAKHSAGK